MPRKLTIDDVRSGFEKRGWKLLSTTYLGSQKKLDVICDQGHETTITWNNFQRGQGCNVCAGNQKFSLDDVKTQFAECGFEFLDTQYVNNNVPVKCRCTCGRITKMPLCTVKKGATCLACKGKKIAKKLSIKKEDIEKRLNSNGHKYLDHWVEHKSKSGKKVGHTIVKYICSCGRQTQAIWSNYKRHPGCWECGKKKKSGDKCHMWNPDRELVELNKKLQKRCWNLVGRILMDQGLVKTDHKADLLGYSVDDLMKHIRKHPLYTSRGDFHIDHIFPVSAFAKIGIADLKLINSLSNLRPLDSNINLSKGDKYIEEAFDIWLKTPDVSAEDVIKEHIVNDVSNHSGIQLIDPKYAATFGHYQHLYYNAQNDSRNILFVFPNEWVERKKQLLHRAKMYSGERTSETLGARVCEVQQIDKAAGRAFCDEYHIQGSNRLATVSFGLLDKSGRLVGVLTLGRHHRGGETLVLDRLAFRSDVSVLGGSEKLFKAACIWAKSREYDQIITFSDRRYTNGSVYKRLGFMCEKSYNCDYSYVLKSDMSVHFSKQSQMKKNTGCPEGLTENQWSEQRGLSRIWDCGKDRWVINI